MDSKSQLTPAEMGAVMHLLLHASLEYFFFGGPHVKEARGNMSFSYYDKAVIDFLEIISIKRND